METKRAIMFAAVLGLAATASFAQDSGANVQVTQPAATTPPTVVTTGTVVVPAQPVQVQQPVAVPAQQPAVVTPTAVNVAVDNNHDDDDEDFDGEFSINPGMAIFQGDSDDYLDDSFSIDLGLYDQWNDISGMGWELGYITDADIKGVPPARLGVDTNGDGIADTTTFAGDASAKILRFTPTLKLGPVITLDRDRHMTLNPYVTGGGGFYWTNYDGDVGSDDDYNGGWNAGGGIMLGLTDDFGIGFDIRYHRIIYNSGPDTTWITPAAKISLLFD